MQRPTTAELLRFSSVSHRVESVRFVRVDRWGNPLGVLYTDAGETPTVGLDATGGDGVARSVSNLVVTADQAAAVGFLTGERVRVVWTFSTGAEYRLGSFRWQQTTELRRSYGGDVSGALVDLSSLLDAGAPASYTARAGERVDAHMRATARELGLADAAIVIANTTVVVADDLAWPAGTPRRTRLRALTDLAGFAPAYFDRLERLTLRPIPDPAVEPATHTYRLGRGSLILADPPPQESTDEWQAPTDYVVVSTAPTNAPVVGVFSRPPADPLSSVYRDPFTRTIERPGLSTPEQAVAAAKAEYLADRQAMSVEFSTIPVPTHDAYEVVDYDGTRMLERRWELQCAPGGEHKHRVERLFTTAVGA